MKELTLDAKIENLAAATDFINEQLEAAGCPMKTRIRIDIAIDELFSNICHYAYAPETGPVTLSFALQQEPPAAILSFIDRGIPYDPLAKADPQINLSAEDRKPGGMGIFIVKKTMDEMTYAYQDGRNILTIKKLF